MINPSKSVLVVAHPDDELLWFSSILDQCKKIVICFTESDRFKFLNAGRGFVKENHPLRNIIYLNLQEADARADWSHPARKDFELRILLNSEKYTRNFNQLCESLENILKDEESVVTHNPWGEYGNEEHVQVFRAVEKISKKIDYKIYVSSYVSDRSIKVMSGSAFQMSPNSKMFATNADLYRKISQLYIVNNCWTWSRKYFPPAFECFFLLEKTIEDASVYKQPSLPLNVIWLDDQQLTTGKLLNILFRRILPLRFQSFLLYLKIFLKGKW